MILKLVHTKYNKFGFISYKTKTKIVLILTKCKKFNFYIYIIKQKHCFLGREGMRITRN